MSKNKIRIGGKEYAAELTAGALMRFKREAGYDFLKEPDRIDTEGVIIMAWAAAKSTALRDGEAFDMDAEEMADRMSLEELTAATMWLKDQTGSDDAKPADDKKKKQDRDLRAPGDSAGHDRT